MALDNSPEAVAERVRIVAEAFLAGHNKTESYRQAGFSYPSATNAANFFRDHREEIDLHVFNAMKGKVPMALTVLEDVMMNGKSDGARVKAATEILDRAGFDQIQRIEITNKEVSELENQKLNEELNALLQKSGRLKLVGGTDVG